MAQNMYRVGDYVYFEISSAAPFQVRRIEELNKTATGNVEAKVMCFYRRRDISPALLKIADDASPDDKSAKKLSPNATPKPGDEENKVENGENTTGERADSISPKPMHVDEGNDEDKQDDAKKDDDKDENQGEAGLPHDTEPLTKIQRHLLRQRELYLSRQIETLPATHIRGKCVVTLLSEVETPDSYLGRDDAFFYSLVFDPQAKTLLADKGEIRVGEKYQSRVAVWDGDGPTKEDEEMDTASPPADGEKSGRIVSVPVTIRETLVYHPFHNLTDRDIDQFLIVARAVGTFSRALDTSSSVKLPSLHMTAAAASRDVTLLHAMALLHHANYDLGQAMKFLVPPPSKAHYPLDADKTTSHNTVSLGGPILCRDQMEEWSAAEANLFEEAIEKYGKDFNDIRQDFLPWKALKDIVEYYYMWKTTNRYVDSKRTKAAEAESRLKQVYIPNYNKPNPNLVGPPNPSGQPQKGTTPCESCRADMSAQWYAWGPAHLQMRLCAECWTSWKKNGGLKRRHQYETYDKSGAKSNTGVAASTDTLNTTGITRGAPMASHQNRSGTANTLAKHGAAMGTGMGGRGGSAGLTNSSAVGSGGGPLNLHAQKPRVAFFLHTTLITRIARRLAPKSLLNVRKCARRPFVQVQGQAIKQHCQTRDPSDIMRVARTLRGGRLEPGILQALREQHQQQQHPTQPQSPALPTPISATGGALKRPLANGDKSSPSAPPAKKLAAVPGLASSHHHHISRSAAVVPPSPIVSHSAGVITSARGGGDGLPDSRWMSTTDTNDRILFLAGPQLKKTRRALCAHRDARRAILSPCTHHPALERGLAKLNSLMCG